MTTSIQELNMKDKRQFRCLPSCPSVSNRNNIKKAFGLFCLQYPNVKISQQICECLRPRNIRLRQYTQRLQCCCTYHMNFIQKARNKLFMMNGKNCPFPNSDALVSATLCQPNSLKCILCVSSQCKTLSKITNLQIPCLKCSKSCVKERHTIKVKQFERVPYIHKEQEKNKLQLVDKILTPSELLDLLKNKLEQFPRHRFNLQQTAKTYYELVANLNEHNILNIHDFSKNYTCLLSEEIQSLHWTQKYSHGNQQQHSAMPS